MLLRSISGDADNGITTNFGTPISEEVEALELLGRSTLEEMATEDSGEGEEIIFNVSRRCLKGRIDEVSFPQDLELSEFSRPVRKSWLKKIFR